MINKRSNEVICAAAAFWRRRRECEALSEADRTTAADICAALDWVWAAADYTILDAKSYDLVQEFDKAMDRAVSEGIDRVARK